MTAQPDARVWVVVPAQNCAHAIGEVIERVNALELGAWIIVVDDCSDDDTSERASKYDNVVVHRNEEVLGFGRTTTKHMRSKNLKVQNM